MAALKMFDIAGKHAIVTGGAQGLSRGMAEGLLEAGCKVVIIDIKKEKVEQVCAEYRAQGFEAYSVVGDLSDRTELNRCFDEALEILDGRLDVLIPAAGVTHRDLPENYPEESWDFVMSVNLNHVWFMIQRALQVMLKQPTGGKIITIGSMASYFGCTAVTAYTAAKGAVAQLTKSVAVDCAGRGININCLCPGYMDTEMTAGMTQQRKDETTPRIPAGRWGTPEDMKGPAVFLASGASDYLNGALIPVDGAYLVK